MNDLVCNYAIARFRPYRETGEFVNVGVVLLCPQADFFGFALERHKHKRITDFFPELDFDIYKAGLSGLTKELTRLAGNEPKSAPQLLFGAEAQARNAVFKELVRPREALFHFSEIATVLAADPKTKLQELFDFHIKRQFAHDREYQEIIMRRRLNDFLQKTNLARFYKQDQRIGDDSYHIVLPFVHYEEGVPRKAIKPLHLDKDAPTDIYRHGDAWVSSVRRLRNINRLPKDFLFAVKYPLKTTKNKQPHGRFATPFSSWRLSPSHSRTPRQSNPLPTAELALRRVFSGPRGRLGLSDRLLLCSAMPRDFAPLR